MENSIYLRTCETFDTIRLQVFIRDTAIEASLSEIVAYVERSLMAYVVNNWKHVNKYRFVAYVIIKDGQRLASQTLASGEFGVRDIARMCGLED